MTLFDGSLAFSNGSSGNVVISGNYGLTKVGLGKLSLAGVNTYYGATIAAGVLNINADAALGTASYPLNFSGNGTLQAGTSGIALPSTRSIAIQNGSIATFDTGTYSMSIAGGISGAGGSLAKIGSGTLTLTGSESYTGDHRRRR